MKLRKLNILFLICLLLTACRGDMGKMTGEDSISVIRYDRLISDYVRFNNFSALQRMTTDFITPTQILIEDVLAIGQVNDDNIMDEVKEFYSDPALIQLITDVEEKYADLSKLEESLTKGFRKLKKEVPAISIPVVYAQISALNESVVVRDSLLGISLDKYMGNDYPLYSQFYYRYQRRSMEPDRILPDCFMFYLMSEYPYWAAGRTLLEIMLHYGKINYVIEQILDYSTSGQVVGYTEEEEKWCKANRRKIWEFMVQNRHLGSMDPMLIRGYTRPAPYTSFFGENTPDLIGLWMGAEIVSSFMKKNKNISISQLLEMTDYHQMLNEADFNP